MPVVSPDLESQISADPIAIQRLGKRDYDQVLTLQRKIHLDVTKEISGNTLLILEHPSVYTAGRRTLDSEKPTDGTPVIDVDRGGKITYHGRGQLIIYPLIDLKRYHLNIRSFVTLIEKSIINFLSHHGIKASAKIEAPGVYIGNKKIASLGLRIKNHTSYHGLSMNIDMDLSPFEAIDPCGFKNLQMTQLKTFTNSISIESAGLEIANNIKNQLLNLKS